MPPVDIFAVVLSGSISPSHVLSAMGVPARLAGAAVRMSLGMLSTESDIDRVAQVFPSLVNRARGMMPAAMPAAPAPA